MDCKLIHRETVASHGMSSYIGQTVTRSENYIPIKWSGCMNFWCKFCRRCTVLLCLCVEIHCGSRYNKLGIKILLPQTEPVQAFQVSYTRQAHLLHQKAVPSRFRHDVPKVCSLGQKLHPEASYHPNKSIKT